MKKIFLLVTMILMVAQGVFADEYTKQLEKMMRAGVVAGTSTATSSFDDIAALSPQLKEYVNDGLIPDMAEIMAPYYRENCSKKEIKQMTEYFTSESNIDLIKKMVSSAQTNNTKMQEQLAPVIQSLMSGGTPKDLEQMECSKEYEVALNKLVEIMSIEKMAKGSGDAIGKVFQSTMQMMTRMLVNMGVEDAGSQVSDAMAQMEAPMKAMGEYLNGNMITVIKNAYIQKLSIEDIQKLSEIEKESFFPAYKRSVEASYEHMGDVVEKTVELIIPKVMETASGLMQNRQ